MIIIVAMVFFVLGISTATFWYLHKANKEDTRRFEKVIDAYLEELRLGMKESNVAHLLPPEEQQRIIEASKLP